MTGMTRERHAGSCLALPLLACQSAPQIVLLATDCEQSTGVRTYVLLSVADFIRDRTEFPYSARSSAPPPLGGDRSVSEPPSMSATNIAPSEIVQDSAPEREHTRDFSDLAE